VILTKESRGGTSEKGNNTHISEIGKGGQAERRKKKRGRDTRGVRKKEKRKKGGDALF